MNSQPKLSDFATALHTRLCADVLEPFNDITAPILLAALNRAVDTGDISEWSVIQRSTANLVANMLLSNMLTITKGKVALAREGIASELGVIVKMIDKVLARLEQGETEGIHMQHVNADGSRRDFDFRDHLTPEDPADRNDSGRNGGIDAP